MGVFIGLDVSLQKTAVCVVNSDGGVVWQGKVDSEPGPLIERLTQWREKTELVGLEACPLSEWLYRALMEAGHAVVCIETRHAQRFLSTRPVKTDRNDARGLAEMLRLGHFIPVHVKSIEAQLTRTLLTARAQLVSSLLQVEAAVRGLLRSYGLKVGPVHRNRFEARARDLLVGVPGALAMAIEPLLRARDVLRREVAGLDRRLRLLARHDPVCRRLMTIPGVGPITSLAFRATIDDPARFATAKAVGAHLGLTPRVYQSGEIDRAGHISKCGDHMMRHLLYEAASALLTRCASWSRLRAWGVAVARRAGAKRARVAVARKLAVIMHRIWVSGSVFQFGAETKAAA